MAPPLHIGMRIMIADDDPLICMFVQGGLKARGHEVIVCESGTEAWEVLKSTPVPIVITDWDMPGLDGLQLTQLVRRFPRDAYTYVIMLTGKGKREDYLTGVAAGVDAFLVKPLDGAILEAQITIGTRILGLQAHAATLEAIMTVCSYCKKVKDDDAWVPMESYVASTFKTMPSHGFCPSCFHEKVEPEMKALGISTGGMGGL